MHKKNNENQGSENKELFLVLKNIIKENMGILLWVLVVINVILIYKLFVSNVSGEGGVNVFLNDNIAKTLNSEFYNQFNTIMAGIYGYHFNSLTNWLAALGILMTICVFVFGFINYDYMDKIDRIIKPRLDDFDKKIGDEFGNNNKEITDKITANFNEKLAKEMKIKDLLYYIEKLRDGKDELLEKIEIYKELIEFEIEDNKEKNWEERVKDAGGGGARDRDFEAGDEWINNIVNRYEYEIAKIYFDLAINEDKDVKKDEQKHKKKDEIFRGYILDSEKLYKKIIGRFIKNEKFLNDKRNITFINNIYANLVWLYVKKYEKFKDSNDFKSGLDYGYKGIEIIKDYKTVDKKEMNIKACMVAMIIRYLNVREKEYKYDSEYEDYYYWEADKLNNEFLKEYFFRNEGYVFKAILLILNFNKLHIEYRKNKEVNKEGFLREQRDIDFFEEAREKIAEINFYYGKYFNMMKEQGENIDVADYKRVSDLYKQMGYLVNHLDIKSFDIKESDKYIEIGIDYFLEAINYRNLGFREYWKNKIDVYLLNESEFINKICDIVENIVLKEIDKLNKDEEENNENEESKGIKEEFDKEIIDFVRDFLTRYFGKFYVDVYSVSFSKNSESFLLWNYYANKMTGIVIEYDRDEIENYKNSDVSSKNTEIDIEIDIVDIVYDKKNMSDELLYDYLTISGKDSAIEKRREKFYSDENLFQIKDRDKLEESIKKYKNKSFKSEEEVRILARRKENTSRYLIFKNSIKGIIFGKYINKYYKKELIYLLKYINEEKEKDKNRMIEIKEMDIIDGKISFNEIKN